MVLDFRVEDDSTHDSGSQPAERYSLLVGIGAADSISAAVVPHFHDAET